MDNQLDQVLKIKLSNNRSFLRPIGNDLRKGERLFPHCLPDSVAYPAMLASVGHIDEFVSNKFKLYKII